DRLSRLDRTRHDSGERTYPLEGEDIVTAGDDANRRHCRHTRHVRQFLNPSGREGRSHANDDQIISFETHRPVPAGLSGRSANWLATSQAWKIRPSVMKRVPTGSPASI